MQNVQPKFEKEQAAVASFKIEKSHRKEVQALNCKLSNRIAGVRGRDAARDLLTAEATVARLTGEFHWLAYCQH